MIMDLLSQFEYPMPELQVNIDSININISSSYEGSLTITNKGGGLLTGKIMSTSSAIEFTPEVFEGNKVKIEYFVSLNMYKAGEKIKTSAVIVSTGGEIEIPIVINVVPVAIETKDGKRINSIKEFYEYSQEEPVLARALFMNKKFAIWLFNMSYPYLDAYDIFVKDANKERALDNFFIISGIKSRGELFLKNRKVVIHLMPYDNDVITQYFRVYKDSNSFVEDSMYVDEDSTFITLTNNKINSYDFDENDVSIIEFSVDISKIKDNITLGKIHFNRYKEVIDVLIIKKSTFSIETSKNYYSHSEVGHLVINNYSGDEIKISIEPFDSHIRFEGTEYLIGEIVNIPFQIKISALQIAGLALKKQPFIKTSITIKTELNNKQITEVLPILIGD